MATKKKECKKGWGCGKTCIAKTRRCSSDLDENGKKVRETYDEYVARISGAVAPTKTKTKKAAKVKKVVKKSPTKTKTATKPVAKDDSFGKSSTYSKNKEKTRDRLIAALGEDEVNRLTNEINNFYKDHEPVMYINPEVLNLIAQSGDQRVKNFFETKTTLGAIEGDEAKNIKARKSAESRLLGVNSSTSPQDRPIYSGFQKKGEGLSDVLTNYGSVAVSFRDLNEDDYSISFGDTFHLKSGAVANRKGDSDIAVSAFGNMSDAQMRSLKGKKYEDIVNDFVLMDRLADTYMEAQIYKNITLDNLKLVGVKNDFEKGKIDPEVLSKLSRADEPVVQPKAKPKKAVYENLDTNTTKLSEADKKALAKDLAVDSGRYKKKVNRTKRRVKGMEDYQAKALVHWIHDYYSGYNAAMIGYDAPEIDEKNPFRKEGVGKKASIALTEAIKKLPQPSLQHFKKNHGWASEEFLKNSLDSEPNYLKRGVSFPDANLAKDFVKRYNDSSGQEIEIGHFFPTTFDSSHAEKFAKGDNSFLMHIKPKSLESTSAKPVDYLKNGTFESELLYPPDTKFKVSRVVGNNIYLEEV